MKCRECKSEVEFGNPFKDYTSKLRCLCDEHFISDILLNPDTFEMHDKDTIKYKNPPERSINDVNLYKIFKQRYPLTKISKTEFNNRIVAKLL